MELNPLGAADEDGMQLASVASLVFALLGQPPLSLEWDRNYLTIRGSRLLGESVRVHYIEAYCRANSTDADWVRHTTIGHRTELIERAGDGTLLKLRCTLTDGVTVEHVILAGADEVDFVLTARNHTAKRSQAHWAQPCVRVDAFTQTQRSSDAYAYVPKCFVFVDGKLARLPLTPWARSARYEPGQVWCPDGVPRTDVNPRPLSPVVTSNGMIGCFSGDGRHILAMAWEPYQELFQGVARCLHSDFRLGGLMPGEWKSIRGKIYVVPADLPALRARYARDFPEHHRPPAVSADVWVAPNGNDENPGRKDAPLRTVFAAQDRVRQMLRSGTARDLAVMIRGGTYRLARPWEFDRRDSAPPGCTVTYSATPRERVVLSGGEETRGFGADGGDWVTPLKSGDAPNELFVGDERRPPCRYPNDGYLRLVEAGPDKRTSFRFRPGDLVPSDAGAELVFLHDWSVSRVPIAAIGGDVATLKDPIGCSAPHYAMDHFERSPRYLIEQSRRALDAPGEWFADSAAKQIRYRAKPGESPRAFAAIVPRLDRLLAVTGDGASKQRVRGLRFVGLEFRHCRFTPPAAGYAEGQATIHERRDGTGAASERVLVPAALQFEWTDSCSLERCFVGNLGGGAVHFGQGCLANQCVESTVEDVAGNGVMVGEHVARPADDGTARRNNVARCLIRRCGTRYFGAVGVWVGIAAETTVIGNEIADLPYTGISLGWSWNPRPTACRDNLVLGNHIHDVVQTLSDGGGIYTLGRQPGTVLRGNVIHGVPANAGRAESNGVFMDEGSSEILVEGNLIHDVDKSSIRFHRAQSNTLRRNRFVCREGVPEFRYNNSRPETMRFEANERIAANGFQRPTAPARPGRRW